MKRTLAAVAIMVSLALIAMGCGQGASGGPEDEVRSTETGVAKPSGVQAIRPVAAPASTVAPPGDRGAPAATAPAAKPAGERADALSASTDETKGASNLDIAQRQVISTASVALEVENVQDRLNQVRAIVESLGGFLENLSLSGSEERQQATVSVRVPQPQFFIAMERITALGKVLSQSVGSEDVTEQFIDLRARLQSAQRQEQSLLSLLLKATSVSDVLTIERELSRIRSEIERFQGQLNFLERRVDLATITISLSQPPEEVGEPPYGSLALEVSDVGETVERVKAAVASLKGVVDRVFVSEQDGVQRAEIALRVFSADFGRAIATIEGQGKVRFKEVSEIKTPPPGAKTPTKPNAQVILSLSQPPEEVGEPPSGSLALEVSDVVETVERVKAAVTSLKGVVDRVFVSERDGVQRAEMALRVFSADFGQAIATMEDQGKVRFREVSEGTTPPPGAKPPTKPNAQVNLSLVSTTASKAGLIAAIAAPVGVVILAVLLGLGFLLARRRRRSPS